MLNHRLHWASISHLLFLLKPFQKVFSIDRSSQLLPSEWHLENSTLLEAHSIDFIVFDCLAFIVTYTVLRHCPIDLTLPKCDQQDAISKMRSAKCGR